MIKYWKYEYEEHFAQTRDKYILCIHRIPEGRKQSMKYKRVPILKSGTTIINQIHDFEKPTHDANYNHKPVVLLYHGLTLTSEVWISNIEKERNLALQLADQGYDVWMGNARGNKYSHAHLTKDPNHADFWQFSIDEFALFDLPDTIDYILKETGSSSLTYIGFSQGTTQAFAGLSMNSDLNKKVNLFIALAPAATPKGFSHPMFNRFIKSAPSIIYFLLGRKIFLKPVLFWQSILSPPLFVKIIDGAVHFLFGWHCNNITQEQKIVSYQHLFSLTSVKSIVHWFQIIGSGRFQMYDEATSLLPHKPMHNVIDHLPPKFLIKQITTPIAVFYGSDDTLVDYDILKNELPHLAYTKNVHNWEHMDFLWASGLEKIVFPDILMLLKHFNFESGDKDV
ncbi:Alpha/Beta hydrolase protein [Pilaira anomala]|nr:Alpha/Beta hydrolase protein [Pilaira anomala]